MLQQLTRHLFRSQKSARRDEEEQKVIEILEKRGDLQINTLVVEADIPVQKMNTILFELEMKGVVRVLVGGMYQLL